MKDGQGGQMEARTGATAQWKSICLSHAKLQFHLHPQKIQTPTQLSHSATNEPHSMKNKPKETKPRSPDASTGKPSQQT